MTPSEQAEARKTAQVAEATQRAQASEADREANADATDVAGDTIENVAGTRAGEPGATLAAETHEEPAPPKQTYGGLKDSVRADIAKGFRDRRAQEDREADADARELQTLAGMPPEFRDLVVDEGEAPLVPAQVEPAPKAAEPPKATEPGRHKVVVRGEERWLSDAELLAAAQKTLAADEYLSEARRALDEAKAARESASQNQSAIEALRAAQPSKHPAGQEGAQPGVIEDSAASEHPAGADPFEDAIEKLQYGDKKEAGDTLRKLVNDAVSKIVPTLSQEEATKQRLKAEHTRSYATLKAFTEANPDLANDEDATALVRSQLYRLQREDLIQAGYDLSKLANDARTPDIVAEAHLAARSLGQPVRSVSDLLQKAKDNYDQKYGRHIAGTAKDAPPQPAQAQATAQQQTAERRVEVNVNRDQRRQAIPPQPTSTVAPRPDQAAAQPKDRADTVAIMRANRMAPRQPRAAVR